MSLERSARWTFAAALVSAAAVVTLLAIYGPNATDGFFSRLLASAAYNWGVIWLVIGGAIVWLAARLTLRARNPAARIVGRCVVGAVSGVLVLMSVALLLFVLLTTLPLAIAALITLRQAVRGAPRAAP